MIRLGEVFCVPVLSGCQVFSAEVRELFLHHRFIEVAVALPESMREAILASVDQLPSITAAVAVSTEDEHIYLCPADPCDAMIEALRQARMRDLPTTFIGRHYPEQPVPLPPLPDTFAADHISVDAYRALITAALADFPGDQEGAVHCAADLSHLQSRASGPLLAIVHMRHFRQIVALLQQGNLHRPMEIPRSQTTYHCRIDTDTLYFALGELPYVTGCYERNRQDPLAPPFSYQHAVHRMFSDSRDNCADSETISRMTPARISRALTYLRNLTVLSGRLMPDLFDCITAAEGVGGSDFAFQTLRQLKYYPYFDPLSSLPPVAFLAMDSTLHYDDIGRWSRVTYDL